MAQNRQLAAPAYLVALALMLIPPMDSMMSLLPFRFGEARWRFGAFGLMSNALVLPLLGVLLAFVAATMFEHYRLRRVIGILTGVAVLIMASSWVVFGLDVLQVKNDIRPEAALAFKVASATAAVKSLIAMITLTAFTLASFRGPKAPSSSKSQRGGVIVGTRGPAIPVAPPREVGQTPAPDATS